MERDSLSLFFSILSLIISIFYFLSFYSFKNSDFIKFNNENFFMKKNNTFICDDINDEITCKKIIFNNNLFKLSNDSNNFYINKNTLICDDINDINTCKCLSNKCDLNNNLNYFLLIDNQITFSESKYGLKFGSSILPIENKNQFSFCTWININIIDLNNWRSIFTWLDKDNNINPAILISPKNWKGCSNLIDIRFSSLNNTNNNYDLNGSFNVTDGNHGHCIHDTIFHYNEWFHLCIIGDKNIIYYYINSNLVQQEKLSRDFKLGNNNDTIYVGGNPFYSCEGVILSKMKWFSKILNIESIKLQYNEKYN